MYFLANKYHIKKFYFYLSHNIHNVITHKMPTRCKKSINILIELRIYSPKLINNIFLKCMSGVLSSPMIIFGMRNYEIYKLYLIRWFINNYIGRKTLFMLIIILDRFFDGLLLGFDTIVVHMFEFAYEVEGIFGVVLINIICISAGQL